LAHENSPIYFTLARRFYVDGFVNVFSFGQSNVVAQKQMEAGREIRVQPHVIAAVAKS